MISSNTCKKLSVFIGMLLALSSIGKAQELFLNADLVSSYIWRGMKCGNASIQPTMGISMGGFTLSTWGTTDFHSDTNEIDINLDYEYKRLKVGVVDYFSQDGEHPNYFNYSSHTTNHTFEFSAQYTFSEKYPISLSWATVFAGNDYKENEKRAFSTYVEAAYPFSVKGFDLHAEIGFTPWDGMYSDKFNITNIGLSIAKAIKITNSFSLPLSGKIIVNPFEEKAYFVFGINL